MSPGDPPTVAAFAAAQALIVEAASAVVAEAATNLLNLVRTAPTYRLRGEFAAAQTQLLQKREPLLREFRSALHDKVASELEPGSEEASRAAATDWDAVSLVDEEQIEDRLSAERVGQLITHECEAELRDLTTYTANLLGHGWSDPERNPLRGNVVGHALHRAIEKVIEEPEAERTLLKEIGHPLAKALPACYRKIVAEFARRGFASSELAMRAPTQSPTPRPPPTFEEARALWERSIEGRPPRDAGDTVRSWESSILGRYGQIDPLPPEHDPTTSAALLERLIRGSLPASLGGPPLDGVPRPTTAPAAPSYTGPRPTPAQSDEALMGLLRRLSANAGSAFGAPPQEVAPGPAEADPEPSYVAAGLPRLPSLDAPASASHFGGVGALMAANLIRAHREELLGASHGKLDHLVIEVVASLFDQILSDPRVAPEVARQIARLQLPVLRVALRDPTFFSSRRHAVRRFINRISALAIGFGSFESESARNFLDRVAALIAEIVAGEFDQLETYDAKLAELERFAEEQARNDVETSAAATTLKAKESEWQQQREFSAQLHAALEPLTMPAYLKEFIAKVWGRVILAVSLRNGVDSAAAQRIRRAAFDLVVSVQPKRSPEQRSRFLSTLPGLMGALNEGMKLIEWPEHENTAFFGKLLAEHAGSLKTAPMSELEYNLLLRGVEAAAKMPLPAPAEGVPAPLLESEAEPALEPRFSADEAAQLGLIVDNAVDWQAHVPLNSEDLAESAAQAALPAATTGEALPGDSVSPEQVPLRDRLELGVACQLHLDDGWERLRLSYMSPGRTMFMFRHGSGGRGTISMTARMLQRLSEAGRLRAIERVPLIDRATARARRQLAGSPTPAAAPPRAA